MTTFVALVDSDGFASAERKLNLLSPPCPSRRTFVPSSRRRWMPLCRSCLLPCNDGQMLLGATPLPKTFVRKLTRGFVSAAEGGRRWWTRRSSWRSRPFLGAAPVENPCGLSCGPAEGRLDQIRALGPDGELLGHGRARLDEEFSADGGQGRPGGPTQPSVELIPFRGVLIPFGS